MPKLVYTDSFAEGYLTVELESKRAEIIESIERLASLPVIGSRNLPASIEKAYGDHVRKLVVKPFDVIYEYDEDADEIRILGIIHAKQAW